MAFLLLVAEMVTFCVLVAPLPYSIKKPLFRFLSESPLIAKVAYGIKIAFMFVLFFVPPLSRMLNWGFAQIYTSPVRRCGSTYDADFGRSSKRQDG
jgi:hypothetical protein